MLRYIMTYVLVLAYKGVKTLKKTQLKQCFMAIFEIETKF